MTMQICLEFVLYPQGVICDCRTVVAQSWIPSPKKSLMKWIILSFGKLRFTRKQYSGWSDFMYAADTTSDCHFKLPVASARNQITESTKVLILALASVSLSRAVDSRYKAQLVRSLFEVVVTSSNVVICFRVGKVTPCFFILTNASGFVWIWKAEYYFVIRWIALSWTID